MVCISAERTIPPAIHPPLINPREALLDPVGAVFGASVFVITILALVGLSAGGLLEGKVGVWTVTAPAAAVIFVRDVGRDFFKHNEERERGGAINVDEKHPGLPASSTRALAHSSKISSSVAPQPTCSAMFPTVKRIISHLPLALVPFAFSFFILVEGLQHTGWIALFGRWWGDWERVGGVAGSVWLMGMLSIIGCNVSLHLLFSILGLGKHRRWLTNTLDIWNEHWCYYPFSAYHPIVGDDTNSGL